MIMAKGKGWFFESRRHKLSALGIKTGRKILPKKLINTNALEGNPMFFPQSRTKEVLKIAELNYTATKLRLAGKTLDQAQLSQIALNLEQKLREKGYSVNIATTGGKMTFKNIRLIPDITGYNISQLGKRGRILNWDDWVKVNNIVNKQLDRTEISANVSSLGGKFQIRQGKLSMTATDWDDIADENIGSAVSPIRRREAWKREKLGYTPKFKASDIGAVATDTVVGTGVQIRKFAPVIAVAKVRQWVRKKVKGDGKRITSRQQASLIRHSKHHSKAHINSMIKSMKKGKSFSEAHKIAIGKGLNYHILSYPQAIKSKYPTVTKEITRLSLKHNLSKPILKYGKNKRLATFIPPNTIKLSKRLMNRGRAKRKDVAQHEFKHLIDTQRTTIQDIAELERRAVKFEKVTK